MQTFLSIFGPFWAFIYLFIYGNSAAVYRYQAILGGSWFGKPDWVIQRGWYHPAPDPTKSVRRVGSSGSLLIIIDKVRHGYQQTTQAV